MIILAAFLLVQSCHVVYLQDTLSSYLELGCNYQLHTQDLKADYVIGGLVPVSKLKPSGRYNTEIRVVAWVESFLLAIDQINKNSSLLPGVKLGYDVRDTCGSPQVALKHTLDFITDIEYYKRAPTEENRTTNSTEKSTLKCKCVNRAKSKLIGIVGGATSTVSSSTSYLGTNNAPQISYAATSPSLSNKFLYPNFLRTVPSDLEQTIAIAELMNYFNWTYVSIIASDDEYGRLAIEKLRENLQRRGVCFGVEALFDPSFPGDDLDRLVNSLQGAYPASDIVIIWGSIDSVLKIVRASTKAGMSDMLWIIGTENYEADKRLGDAKIKNFHAMQLKVSDLSVNSFKQHMLNEVKYQSYLNNVWIRPIWRKFGICDENDTVKEGCWPLTPNGGLLTTTGHENVMAAIYAFAYGLHDYLECNSSSCNYTLADKFDYNRLLDILKRPGNQFSVPTSKMFIQFDTNGDATVNAYSLELLAKEKQRTFGSWSGKEQKILINDHTIWSKYGIKKPNATCAYNCQPGTYKVAGQSVCCWKCLPCLADEVSSRVDAPHCKKCGDIEVPNAEHNKCIRLTNMKITFDKDTGKVIFALSSIAFVSVIFVLAIFVRYWNTPVVKSSSREMSMIQLFCMMILFAYPILHVPPPSMAMCMVRKILFGSLHTLILAFILVKTYRLLRVFQPKRFSKISKFLQNKYQVMSSFLFVVVLLMFLSAWYYTHLPQIQIYISKTDMVYVYHCGVEEDILLYVIVCYIITLSLATGFMAFRGRKLPSNFNEGQYIWLAMFTYVLAWIMLFPLYSTQTTHIKPVILIGVNGIATFCLLLILYGYKIRIILFKPHLNTAEHFSKLAANATVTTFLKEVDPSAITNGRGLTSQRQSVISFDFDGMFEEYQKQKERKGTARESFKHFPKALRLSKRLSKRLSIKKDRKQKAKDIIKAKNRTLQLRKTRSIDPTLKSMPPKSASFDDNQIFSGKRDKNTEFFIAEIDITDSQGSRLGSNTSLIHTRRNNLRKQITIHGQSNEIFTALNQSSYDTYI